MSSHDIILKLSNIESYYGPIMAIRGISLEVPRGKIVTLLGANGAGKTTVLKTISGILDPQKGSIEFKGQPIQRMEADRIVRLGLSHVPEGREVFPFLSVRENLMMGAYLPKAAAGSRQQLEEVFTLLPKLRDRQAQVAGTLSGGERRMVGIGRGLMADARLLMLDEPSLGLAPIIIDQIYEVIQSLTKAGKTLVVVEENALRIADLADRVHLLDNGNFVWSGTGAEFLSSTEILSSYLGG